MTDSVSQIIQHLSRLETLRELADKANMLEGISALQAWQCKRLLASHEDLRNQKRFQPAMAFFVDELYGPKDFSQRDQDIARVVPKLSKVLPDKAIQSLEAALHLNTLSFDLDFALARALEGRQVNRDTYADAYRTCRNLPDRTQQIDYIDILGRDLADVVKIRGISMLLKMARKPAKIAGLLSLHEFLEQGYDAFRQIGDVEDFIVPVVTRERTIMTQLFDHAQPNPLPEGI